MTIKKLKSLTLLSIPGTCKFLFIALVAGIAFSSNNSFANAGENKQFLTSAVGNLVWSDYDRNGKQDSGERGVPNVEIVLYDGNNQVLSTTRSDASGFYSFTGLNTEPAGKVYQILFKLPIGYLFSPKNSSFTDAENSDADEATGKTNLFTLQPGQINNDIDAGLIGPNGTLPLHRLNLNTVLVANNQVLVTWEAENELNTTLFIIQRSFNGVNFSDIASKPPSGPVNTPTTYQVIDNLLGLTNPGCIYYRVKAMDSDGRVAFSIITMIKFSNKASAIVWPAPFTEKLNLTYHAPVSTGLRVILANGSGNVIRELNLSVNPGANQILLSGLGHLSAGIYFIRIHDKNTNEVYIRKISK